MDGYIHSFERSPEQVVRRSCLRDFLQEIRATLSADDVQFFAGKNEDEQCAEAINLAVEMVDTYKENLKNFIKNFFLFTGGDMVIVPYTQEKIFLDRDEEIVFIKDEKRELDTKGKMATVYMYEVLTGPHQGEAWRSLERPLWYPGIVHSVEVGKDPIF